MSRKSIRPSTLDGIKRLASSLKAEQQIQHARALDLAAQAAGFQNFIHASHVLRNAPGTESRPSGHLVYLTAYWKDRESSSSGRETLTIRLTSPWTDLITPALLRNHNALAHFRAEGPDHLSREFLVKTQSEARRAVCAAARAFQFMDATKLRPSRSFSRVYPGGDSRNAIPGRDHFSIWYDKTTKRYLFADEPYESSVHDRLNEREAWARQHGFAIVKPQWPGMYAPDIGSRLYLIAHQTKGIPLGSIAALLNKLPKPIVEERWNGESAPMMPYFVSPGSVAKAAISKAKHQSHDERDSPSAPAKGLIEIRVGWNVVGRRNSANKPIQAGLWQPDTPENRKALTIIAESGNEAYGTGTHWVEERTA
jgi:hypothetical protein